MDKSTNGGCIGSRFDHGLQIKLEVADVPIAKLVALLAEYDLVNEPTGLRIRAWQPWGHDTRKTSLKRFQEGHEIPHSEYVRLEKNPQVLDVSDLTIKWMVHKALARRGNNLEKARNRFSLSWHMLSMQQTGPGIPESLATLTLRRIICHWEVRPKSFDEISPASSRSICGWSAHLARATGKQEVGRGSVLGNAPAVTDQFAGERPTCRYRFGMHYG